MHELQLFVLRRRPEPNGLSKSNHGSNEHDYGDGNS